ncbi:MAG: HAMP domain-containing histidine kinase [Chloroflexi bacterium]|nr:HAMP domain-containing histidine kinase [Chloroflexota bacterium]
MGTTSVVSSAGSGITYAVSPAVSLAAVPLFGPFGSSLIEAFTAISIWVFKPASKSWQRSWSQLLFNIGMAVIAMFVGSLAFVKIQTILGSDTLVGQIVPWLVASTIMDQLNLILLLGIIRLQKGKQFKFWGMWKQDLWASGIAIVITSIGGGILAFAVNNYDWVGIIIFFLPVLLSAYAFRLYVRQMQAHMDNLETIITERTGALQQVMKEKDQFLTVLTHDMKSPLTTINLYASLLRDHPHLLEKKPHMPTIILDSQKTLTEIVNNILDLEKIEGDGTISLDKEDFDFIPLIEKVIKNLRIQAMRKEIDLQFETTKLTATINADRLQIERIIQNLLSNAIKYTPHGGRIRICFEQTDEAMKVSFVDNGYGIPAEELPFVFDRFRRVAKHKKSAAGTGLGLAITKALIEAHSGNIDVASVENEGSTFTVSLPIYANY